MDRCLYYLYICKQSKYYPDTIQLQLRKLSLVVIIALSVGCTLSPSPPWTKGASFLRYIIIPCMVVVVVVD